MTEKILYVASTRSHILAFHVPYLKALKERGLTLHGAWGGVDGDVPHIEKHVFLPFTKRMTSAKNFAVSRRLRRLIQDEGYDCIIVHTSLAAFFTRLAVLGLKNRPRVINMVHGYLFDDTTPKAKRNILLAAEKLTAPVTDLLLTMNKWDTAAAARYGLGKKIANIPGLGVDFSRLDDCGAQDGLTLRQELGFGKKDFLLVFPAEFSPRKNQSVLLHAMTQLPEQVKLLLPGAGATLDSCKALAAQLQISHRVVFPGHVSDIARWYGAADAAVSSSSIEGLPFNIMEAMYCGLPVVASSVKGHTDLIRHEENGLLYPYGDADACAEAIRRLLDAPSFAAALAKTARQDAEQYALDAVVPQVMAQYDSQLRVPAPV